MNFRLVLCLLVCLLAANASAGILHGPVINPANGRAYYLLEADTWQGSASLAVGLGGHLVVINDAAENDWVASTFGRFGGVPRNLWIGLSDAAQEGTFEWVNREPVSYTHWRTGEPNNSQTGENYAFIVVPGDGAEGFTGEWIDAVNAGDGGAVHFHGVVEADHLEHDSAAEWAPRYSNPSGVFSMDSNPIPWTFGWRDGVSGAFRPFPTSYTLDEYQGVRLYKPDSVAIPNARVNDSKMPAGQPLLQPCELVFEPGANGEYCEGIWLSPMSGSFVIEATFLDIDPEGDGQDVHVLVDGVEVFSAVIDVKNGSGRATYVSPKPIKLAQRQNVIIRVGKGGESHNAQGDSTRIDAMVRYPNASVAYSNKAEVSGVQMDNAGNTLVTVDQGTTLIYDAAGNFLSKGLAEEPYRDSEGNYVRFIEGKIRKYAPDGGQVIWERSFPGSHFTGLRLDSGGNVVVAGNVADILGGTDCYVAKYASKTGDILWEKRIDKMGLEKGIESHSSSDQLSHVEVDSAGNVLVIGASNYVGATGEDFVTKSYCVQKHAAEDGRILWRNEFTTLFKGDALALGIDSQGNILAFGADNYVKMHVWKFFGTNGQIAWAQHYENPFGSEPSFHSGAIGGGRFSFDAYDNVVVTALVNGVAGYYDFDLYAAKFEANKGRRFWERRWRTPTNDWYEHGVAVHPSGDIVIAGAGGAPSGVRDASNLVFPSTHVLRYTAPLIDDQYAELKGHTDVVLHALARFVDPEIKVYFEYGTDANYGMRSPEMALPESGLVSALIAGLSAPNIYHFRLVAQTSQGAVMGDDQVFDMAKAPNLRPVAQADSYEDPLPAGSSEFVIDVLANDSDADGDQIRITSVSQGLSHGQYGTVLTDGAKVIYKPAAGFSADRFSYTIADAYGATASASVTVLRNGERPPVATDDFIQMRSDVVASSINVLANDKDPEGKPLSIISYFQGAHGVVSSGSAGYLYYKPADGFVGEDQFTYTVSDGILSSQATVKVSVIGLIALDDVVQVASEPTDIDVLANDIDPDGRALSVVSWTQPVNGRAFATSANRMRYIPNAGFLGEDQFTYTITNHDRSAQGTVRVTVIANTPPVAVDDVGLALSAPVEIDVLANDKDPEGKPLTIGNFTQPAHGNVSDTTESGVLRYSPAPGFIGVDQFTYTVSDGVHTAQGTVRVTVSTWLAESTVVASSQGDVPGAGEVGGVPTGAKFRNFGIASLNDREDVAFVATYSAGRVSGSGIFAGAPLKLIARTGARAPGTNSELLGNGEEFYSFKDPLLNARGDVAFLARVSKAGARTDSGLWLKPVEGDVEMVLREGDVAAGTDGARWSAFISVGLTDSGAIPFVARLRVGSGRVTQGNALGLWIRTTSGTSLLLRQGDWITVGAKPKQVRTFAALTSTKGSPGHGRLGAGEEVLARVSWSDRTQSLVKVAPGAPPEIIASTGDVVTGSKAEFASFGIPSPDKQGRFVVEATLQKDKVAGVSAANDDGVFTYSPTAGWATVTREGGGGYWGNKLGDPIQNDEGIIAFGSRLRGALYDEIWWTTPIGLRSAFFSPLSTEFLPRSIVSFALPNGQYAYVCLAKMNVSVVGRPVVHTSRRGLWAVDGGGLRHLLCYEGQTSTVNGVAKTVRTLDTLRMVPGSPAQPRSYNSHGEMISRVTFTDGTQALLKAELPQ